MNEKLKVIGKLFIWFCGEAITGVLSQAIAESVSKNPFIYYPILVVCFAIGSLASILGVFWKDIEDIFS